MRSTAISPATSRCAWRSPRGRNPRELAAAIVAALPPSALVAAHRDRRRRLHQLPPRHRSPTHASSRRSTRRARRYGESRLGGGERVLLEFVSANPTGPLHVGHGRQAAYGATLANILGRRRLQRRARVLHQRRRAADGHPRGQHLAALPRGVRRAAAVPRERLSRRVPAAAGAAAARRASGSAAPRRRRGARRPAAGCPGGRQGGLHRCAHRPRARAARRGRLSRRCSSCRSARCSADIREDLSEFGVRFDHWTSERAFADERRDRSRARRARGAGTPGAPRRRAVVPRHRVRRREGPRGGARERAEDLLRLRHRLSPRQARARLRAPHRRARRRSSRLRGAGARRAHRPRPAAGVPRGAAHPVREPVPRRRRRSRWASARRSS